jgi:dihydrofolate reductase
VADFVAELRQQDGGTIGTVGSPSLVRSLIDQELLDRLTLMMSPVAAGGGRKRLFADDAALTKFRTGPSPADQQWRTDRDLPADPIADQDRVGVRPESALHPAGRTPR